MSLIVRIIVTTLAAIITAYLLPGVHIDNVMSAIILAVVLAVLNALVKPLLVLLTLPITILTLGLFLIVINAFIILIASNVVSGFEVDGFWWAALFSLVLSLIVSILSSLQDSSSNR